jgi:hypothetical protein
VAKAHCYSDAAVSVISTTNVKQYKPVKQRNMTLTFSGMPLSINAMVHYPYLYQSTAVLSCAFVTARPSVKVAWHTLATHPATVSLLSGVAESKELPWTHAGHM